MFKGLVSLLQGFLINRRLDGETLMNNCLQIIVLLKNGRWEFIPYLYSDVGNNGWSTGALLLQTGGVVSWTQTKSKVKKFWSFALSCLLCLWFKRNQIPTLEWTGSSGQLERKLGGLNSTRISIEKNLQWSRNERIYTCCYKELVIKYLPEAA